MSRLVTLVVSAAALFGLAGCSIGAGTPTLGADVLAEEVSAALTAQVGQAPDSVVCPEDLEGIVGTTTVCTLYAGADSLDVTVEVTGVDGTDIRFRAEVATTVE